MKYTFIFLIGCLLLVSCGNNFQGCTEEAKLCPDGSSVGRVPPFCEFEPCPDVEGCTKDAKSCPDGTVVGRIPPDCEFAPCPGESEEKHFCKPEDRKADMCITLEDPVCGWNDPEKIVCIRYPCAQTYSNSCEACKDENVLYYTKGMCPTA